MLDRLNEHLHDLFKLASLNSLGRVFSSCRIYSLQAQLGLLVLALVAVPQEASAATFAIAYNKPVATAEYYHPIVELFAFSDNSTVSVSTRKGETGSAVRLRFVDSGGTVSTTSFDPVKGTSLSVYGQRGLVDTFDRFLLFYVATPNDGSNTSDLHMAAFSKTGVFLFDKLLTAIPPLFRN